MIKISKTTKYKSMQQYKFTKISFNNVRIIANKLRWYVITKGMTEQLTKQFNDINKTIYNKFI